MSEPARPDPGPDPQVGLPEALLRFVELVNAGQFWESHEVLEAPWRASRSGFYHGLILYASAFVHARRGKARGIVAQLEKAERALAPYPGAYLGLDVDALQAHARASRAVVVAPEWQGALEWPVLELSRERIRGDEPELDALRPARRGAKAKG